MKLTPALEYEKLRQEKDNWNKIFLHKDGKFFRAYEWSAWLIKTVVCTEEFQKERGDISMLAANRYVTKKGEYASVGFPLESLSKYIPSYGDVGYETEEDYIQIDVEMTDADDVTYEQLREAFDAWKKSLPEKAMRRPDKSPVGRSVSNIDTASGRAGLFTILSQVLSYPLESRSPSDNAEFISSLKQQLASLL